MKWYFCLNEAGLSVYAEAMIAGVHSALQNTTLEPNLIYDGPANEITLYLENIGVKVHYHKNSFWDKIQAAKSQAGFSPNVARGAYLRLDIPVVDQSDDIVLYTDVDVLFLDNPDFSGLTPNIFAAAPEYGEHENQMRPYNGVFNSGVMLMNLKEFRKRCDALINLAAANDFYFHGHGGFYDQGALNKFFEGQWEILPQALNWRPFARNTVPPQILHFHGTKPFEVMHLISGTVSADNVRDVCKKLYGKDPVTYIMAFGAFMRFLTPTAVEVVRKTVPDARGVVNSEEIDILSHKNALCAFFYRGSRVIPSEFYDRPYTEEFSRILQKYLSGRNHVDILEWGSGFTTLLTTMVLDRIGVPFHIDSIDNARDYKDAVAKWLYAGDRINFVLQDLTGPGHSQRDPELAYSTWPLTSDTPYDFIFIDGRRRVECAYIASLIAKPETIVVIHDFRRGRYQPVLGLFDILEETEQFRVMKVRSVIHDALADRKAVIKTAQQASRAN